MKKAFLYFLIMLIMPTTLCAQGINDNIERGQNSTGFGSGEVYSPFKKNPKDTTQQILNAAMKALESIYIEGIHYKRAGVILSGMCPENAVQMNRFDIPEEYRAELEELRKAAVGEAVLRQLGRYVRRHRLRRSDRYQGRGPDPG